MNINAAALVTEHSGDQLCPVNQRCVMLVMLLLLLLDDE